MKNVVTYSPAYTLVPTYECFNRCSYCNFRTNPHESPWLELDTAKKILASLSRDITEILILSGEIHPLSSRRQSWIQRVYDIADLALQMGFYPHTNIGPLTFAEMVLLKQVNVSMGLMLEQLTPHLLSTVHRHAPSKDPTIRLQQLEWAGKLQIPFTTGILIGIGETMDDRRQSLNAIVEIHQRWGHIQEVILQPYSPGSQEEFLGEPLAGETILEIVAIAREILPEDIVIQVPPNLIDDRQLLLKCLQLGATDLGGIVPKDEVNPDYHHNLQDLENFLTQVGYQLKPRLPVY
jgi:7,8-didemethyl-8-hydroxy-5-deazariboflavin synthase